MVPNRSGANWGILTNGRQWRLIPRVVPPGKPRFRTYFEVDLPAVLEMLAEREQTVIAGQHIREFLYFYLLFSPSAFTSQRQRLPLIERASRGSSEYALGVTEDLKERVFQALRLTVQGFLNWRANGLSPDRDLEVCRESGFVFLYRLLFIMYAEDRGLLPYRINQTYTNNRSLARLRDEVTVTLTRRGPEEFSAESTALWQDLHQLFDLVDSGHARYGVPAYNGGLFSQDDHVFLTRNRLSDRDLAQIIDKLSRTLDPKHPNSGLFRVDYRDLAIRQLGGIYEGLLELHPRHANHALVVIRRTRGGEKTELYHPADQPIPLGFRNTDEVIPRGSVYLQTDKGERRATGSYYTPDHIVDHIVQHTLQPICACIHREIEKEVKQLEEQLLSAESQDAESIRGHLARIRGEFPSRLLKIRVLDPAMGSGHFLIRACQFLAEEIATNPFTPEPADDQDGEEEILAHWKRKVAERSLYGVDKNPLAVELAQLVLWLETVAKDKPLTFLAHHLRHGNSLEPVS